jgi:hypothetical protein
MYESQLYRIQENCVYEQGSQKKYWVYSRPKRTSWFRLPLRRRQVRVSSETPTMLSFSSAFPCEMPKILPEIRSQLIPQHSSHFNILATYRRLIKKKRVNAQLKSAYMKSKPLHEVLKIALWFE